ncbi:MAG: FtsH protease activity modulator HflK [Pseudomonadota bacterium]
MPWKDNNESGPSKMTGGGPWGNKGSNGNGGSPWNRPGGSGGSGGDANRPDLEEQMRRMQERFRGRSGGRGGRGGGSGGGMGRGGFLVLASVALIAWLASGVVIVDAGQQASIFRFGKWTANFGPGLHLHLPTPIERHIVLPVEQQNETTIGRSTDESLMLTGDENIVNVEFAVFWKIDTQSPQDYILNVDDPQNLVKAVSESVMREVVGKSDLQDIITTERAGVQNQVGAQTQALLTSYRAGVEILDVQVNKADAPDQVIDAFLDVVNAAQDATTTINEATKFANETVPVARGEAQRIIQDAEGYRDQVVADAEGQASRFRQIYEEYRQAPRVTRERMFLETMEKVLGRSDKIILDNEAGAVPYLPLYQVRQ